MKKNCSIAVIAASLIVAVSCANNANSGSIKNNIANAKMTNPDTSKYTLQMVDNKKDFVCKMPLSAGIGDTAHYQGKVYGFCSKQCKDDFLKNPKSYLEEKL